MNILNFNTVHFFVPVIFCTLKKMFYFLSVGHFKTRQLSKAKRAVHKNQSFLKALKFKIFETSLF